MKCKITNSTIDPFMSFGKMPIANGFLYEKDFKNEFFFEMEVGFNEALSLFQLNNHPSPSKMFNENYPFFTSSSEFMKLHFKKYADWIKNNYLKTSSKIIEIGSNDGTFLNNFDIESENYIGIEPSKNVASVAIKNNINTLNSFFSYDVAKNLNKFSHNTDIIFAANAICHIPNLVDVIKGVDHLLTKKGLFIFEEPYLGSMFDKTAYDQIYDEHIFMFSASSIKKIFKMFDMDLINVLPQITHGGSLRYVLARKNAYKINLNVEKIIEQEKKSNLDNIDSCLKFKKECEKSKKRIVNILNKIKNDGKKVCGYAATSKSTTVLNYCNIDKNIIDYICDTTKEKIGKYTPGTHIPIVSMSHFHNNLPEFAYLFAWNHKKEIFDKEKNFVKNGGEWISHVSI